MIDRSVIALINFLTIAIGFYLGLYDQSRGSRIESRALIVEISRRSPSQKIKLIGSRGGPPIVTEKTKQRTQEGFCLFRFCVLSLIEKEQTATGIRIITATIGEGSSATVLLYAGRAIREKELAITSHQGRPNKGH